MLPRILLALAVAALAAGAEERLDFRNAVIVVASDASLPRRTAARMISEEVEKRTQLRLPVVNAMPESGAVILLERTARTPTVRESFTLTSFLAEGRAVARVAAAGDRGAVFGAGFLLRRFEMARQKLEIAANLKIDSAPSVAIRGHQLGYRPKTNTYDGWSVPMWEQYIRELAIFGTNTIELIPPRSDDANDSPHFPLPKMEMMVEMSRIANMYDLDVSIWYPAMDRDYNYPATVERALAEWGEVFRRLPRIDAVFVPGGDPGRTQPRVLFALLEKQAANLRRFHPGAQMWISPQGFNRDWMEEFYSLLAAGPDWLTGVVYGPQVRDDVAELRRRVPSRYRLRLYPDITHSIECEFPVADWDPAFATTEGRESINPRPRAHAAIFRALRPFVDGFISYSEGANDDVNKFVWSVLGWNPEESIEDILLDYSHFFIGGESALRFARGLLALENNWNGPLSENAGVDATAVEFREMEKHATPHLRLNWRFQQALYRAYYDAFLRSRLKAENGQEVQALSALGTAKQTGSLASMANAEEKLDSPELPEEARNLRARVFELAEALFQSIHMQLSVERYQAISIDRGANLDAIDFALNNRVWLKKQFAEIRALASEPERLKRLDAIVNWENPGEGGFHDDPGRPGHEPHLIRNDPASDPELRHSVFTGFGELIPQQGWRTSWYTDAESLYDQPVRMKYSGLDANTGYRVRVLYGGDMQSIPIRLVANEKFEIHPWLKKSLHPVPVEFDIPREATRDGTLTLEWTRPAGLGGNGRGCQISEVWLIRKNP